MNWLQKMGSSSAYELGTALSNQFGSVQKGRSPIGFPVRNAASNWLTKIASVEIMYHGTSAALAPKILSEGLVPGRELVWDKEKTKEDIHSRESYGGIYFSDNFMTAFMAARTSTEKFGQERLIIMAQLEMRSPHILMDEDKILEPRMIFDKVLGVVSNGWFYCSWVKDGMPRLDDIIKGYLDELSVGLNEEIKPGFEDIRQREALVPAVSELIKTSALREIAIAMQKDSTLNYQFPEFENLTISETESNYRNAANQFMNKTKFLTNIESSFSHNVRSLEPISYRGVNKILLVAKMNESIYDFESRKSHYIDNKYNLEAEILYVSNKSVIGILTQDMVQRIGGGIRVRDNYGKVYFEQPRKDMAA